MVMLPQARSLESCRPLDGVSDMHFGIGIGGPIWLISTLLMCAWLAWFGFAARRPARHPSIPKDCVSSKAKRTGDLT